MGSRYPQPRQHRGPAADDLAGKARSAMQCSLGEGRPTLGSCPAACPPVFDGKRRSNRLQRPSISDLVAEGGRHMRPHGRDESRAARPNPVPRIVER